MGEQNQERWLRVDLHIHSPASIHPEKEGSLLQILRHAESRTLDIIGLVDHNSVRGYEQMRLEMSRLTVLKAAGRLSPEEDVLLTEYQRLLNRLLLLPGFELTTQEGVRLLALFSPETSAEWLYALLLNLGIPMERLREGSADIRAQADARSACALLSQSGGLVIAAPSSSAQHLAGEEPLPSGLLAVEAAALPEELPTCPLPFVWFSGSYCLQNRAERPAAEAVGDRYTEVMLPVPAFEALRDLLGSREPGKVRFPERERLRAQMEQLRRQGEEHVILYGETVDPNLAYRDVAALANSGGGTLMVGLSGDEVVGVQDPENWSTGLSRSVREHLAPAPRLNLELLRYGGKEVIRVQVHVETPPPYLTSEGIVYVRREGTSRPTTRQELVELVAAGLPNGATVAGGLDLPQAGVEIVGAYLRDGVWFYDVRDLRVTSGVTRQRAKGLWAYAIERQESLRQGRADLSQVRWKGDRGVWRAYRSGERRVFDLVHRDSSDRVDHIFYGVSEWGLIPRWREVVEAVKPPLEEGVGMPVEEGGAEERETRPARTLNARSTVRPAANGQREHPPAPTVVEQPVAAPTPEADDPVEEVAPIVEEVAVEAIVVDVAAPVEAPGEEEPIRPSPDAWGGRTPRWRGQAAVERVYWEASNVFFDLAMRQADSQVRYFRRVHRNQLTGAEGWVDLVRVPLPATGVEVVRCTTSGDEMLYQFRDMQSGRVDPRVRRKNDFASDSPYAYAIERYHQDMPLNETLVRWWGNIGYLRANGDRLDLVYRDEEGRDHIYYAAERGPLEGEWRELLRVWKEEL